jgi:hypothetical protein
MASCKITPLFGVPGCQMKAKAGDTVTLICVADSGNVQFVFADYEGTALTVPSDRITFQVKPGRTMLNVVYAFDQGRAGTGVLKEDCENAQTIRNISGNDTNPTYTICEDTGAPPAAPSVGEGGI